MIHQILLKSFWGTLIWISFFLASNLNATNYYFDANRGHDDNPGTSLIYPFQSLDKIQSVKLMPGDTVLLCAGQTFFGSIILKDIKGSDQNPIVITSYVWSKSIENDRASIDAQGFLNGILIQDCSHILVENLMIKANGGGVRDQDETAPLMRCGVLVKTTHAGISQGIVLSNLSVQDVFFEDKGYLRGEEEVRTANGTQSYGWGIRFINQVENAELKDLEVEDCVISNVAHTGIKFTGRNHNIQDVRVLHNRVLRTGGPGIQMSGIINGHISGNFVSHSGSADDTRKWGRGSGLWTWGSDDVIVENNYFMHANGPADSAGCHIDFNCNHIVVQYNLSAHNAGGFCEILGNNRNCAYRYNISINDGHREKGKAGAFQEGKTFWLSGYVGRNKERHGPYNSYFYNNTIYANADIISKIAITKTAEGVLVANNLFYVEGPSKAVLGDQYNPDIGGFGDIPNVVFEQNLFLSNSFWPKEVLIQPGKVRTGDPQFSKKGGIDLVDYIPTNVKLIRDQGIVIPNIPNDTVGLKIGLNVGKDIFGNKIKGLPDLGAIEVE